MPMPRTRQPVNAAFHEHVLSAFMPGIQPSIGDCQACFFSGVQWLTRALEELGDQPDSEAAAFVRDVNLELQAFSKHLLSQAQKPENN